MLWYIFTSYRQWWVFIRCFLLRNDGKLFNLKKKWILNFWINIYLNNYMNTEMINMSLGCTNSWIEITSTKNF